MRLFLGGGGGGGGVFTLYYVTAHPGLVPRPVLFWRPWWVTVEDLALDPKTCNKHWCFLNQQFEDACHLPASSSCYCEKFSSWRLVYLSTGQKICWLGSSLTLLMHIEVLLWGQGTGPRLVSANPKVLSSPNRSPHPLLQHALHRSGPKIGPHRGCSSLQIQNLALPVILVEKVKTQETEKQHLLFMTEDVTAFTKCQGKPFPGSVF